MAVLVTGVAGFIGMHVAKRLIAQDERVIGIDNIDPYYDVQLKRERVRCLETASQFEFHHLDLTHGAELDTFFERHAVERVVHLAAQAGVRYSLKNPQAYVHANLEAFLNVLEACRRRPIAHLVYASSSSVYGSNATIPFSEHESVAHPVSLYGATKRANELMAHSYSHLFGIPTTGLRVFTAYGPWGRPDMALTIFTEAILQGRPVTLFNWGRNQRDFTYVEDIAEGVVRVLAKPPNANRAFDPRSLDNASGTAPSRIFNIGSGRPVAVLEYLQMIEEHLGIEAKISLGPPEPGDMVTTFADTAGLAEWIGYQPTTQLREGVRRFIHWFRDYYRE